MSKRFGRNQRRQMRADILTARMEALEVARKSGEALGMLEATRQHEVRQLEEGIRAARMARDTIRIDVDSLIDEREGEIRMRAQFDIMSKRAEPIYSALNIDGRDMMRKSDIERAAFVKLVGRQLAEHALAQIIRHWRSR